MSEEGKMAQPPSNPQVNGLELPYWAQQLSWELVEDAEVMPVVPGE